MIMSLDFSNVKSWNIPEGEVLSASLNGVTVWEKQSPTPTPAITADVTFIDYDGTILYEYTAADFLNLSALPATVDHTSLCDGLGTGTWNVYSLDVAKNQVRKYGKSIFGQTCMLLRTDRITDTGATPCYTIFYEDVTGSTFNISYGLAWTSSYTIYFDDGVSVSSISPTSATNTYKSLSTNGSSSGMVAVAAKYSGSSIKINLSTDSDSSKQSYYLTSPVAYKKDTDDTYLNRKVKKMYISGVTKGLCANYTRDCMKNYENLTHINLSPDTEFYSGAIYLTGYLLSNSGLTELVIPRTFPLDRRPNTTSSTVDRYYSLVCSSPNLKYISYPVTNSATVSGYMPYTTNATSLEKLYVPYTTYKMIYVGNDCTGLKEVILPCGPLNNNGEEQSGYGTTINSCFKNCTSLESIKFTRSYGNGTASDSQLVSISNNSFQNLPTTCKIYVPNSCLTQYKSISGMPDPTVYEYIGY